MFRAKTVFVIGAGASYDFDFPLGDKLLEKVAAAALFKFEHLSQRPTSGNRTIFEALRQVYWPDQREQPVALNAIIAGGRRLHVAASQYLSIDALIENLQDENVTIMAKMAIASAILEAEAGSLPFKRASDHGSDRVISNVPNLSGFQTTWYRSLARCLFEGVTVDKVGQIFNNISFVIFNYDRCLEQYLYQALMVAYPGMSERDAQDLVDQIEIVRPYGSVGILPWQAGNAPKIPFGHNGGQSLIGAHRSILTFSEQVTDQVSLDRSKRMIGLAARIVFLGFGFHKQNIALLECAVRKNAEVYGTALKLPETEKIIIDRDLRSAFKEGKILRSGNMASKNKFSLELINCTCRDFCTDYWRTLTGDAPPDLGEPVQQ